MALPPGAFAVPVPPAAADAVSSVDHARPRLPLVLPRKLIQTITIPFIGAAILVACCRRCGFAATCGARFGSPRHKSAGDGATLTTAGWYCRFLMMHPPGNAPNCKLRPTLALQKMQARRHRKTEPNLTTNCAPRLEGYNLEVQAADDGRKLTERSSKKKRTNDLWKGPSVTTR